MAVRYQVGFSKATEISSKPLGMVCRIDFVQKPGLIHTVRAPASHDLYHERSYP